MEDLAAKKCPPCDSAMGRLEGDRLRELSEQLGAGWKVVDDHHIEKTYSFKDFQEALDFTNRLGVMAEEVGHHPDIYLTWGKVKVTIFTHSVGGLTENDFILAAKLEKDLR